MVALRNHGGSCCGALHIYGFTTGRAEDLVELQAHTSARDRCLHEVILNQGQCQQNPALLAKLAELGYVLTTGFMNGNHNSSVYVFHRASDRLRLNHLPFEWTGQIASPSLGGRLPTLPQNAPNRPIVATRGAHVSARDIRTGDRFTYYNPSNHLHGATLTRRSQAPVQAHTEIVALVHEATGMTYERAIGTLRWSSQANVPAANEVAIPLQRHTQNAAPLTAPAPEPRRIVFSSFHNVYRDGRVGAGYQSRELAREAAPRAISIQRLDVYSDGSTEITINV